MQNSTKNKKSPHREVCFNFYIENCVKLVIHVYLVVKLDITEVDAKLFTLVKCLLDFDNYFYPGKKDVKL